MSLTARSRNGSTTFGPSLKSQEKQGVAGFLGPSPRVVRGVDDAAQERRAAVGAVVAVAREEVHHARLQLAVAVERAALAVAEDEQAAAERHELLCAGDGLSGN